MRGQGWIWVTGEDRRGRGNWGDEVEQEGSFSVGEVERSVARIYAKKELRGHKERKMA